MEICVKVSTQLLPQLEKAVTEVNPRSHVKDRVRPVAKEISELKVSIDPKTEENLETLKDLLSQKLKRAATLSEVIAWISEMARERIDPERKAKRSRALAKKISSGKNAELRGRHPIPAAVKNEVLREQGRQCSIVGGDGRRCEQKRWLEFHHITPVAMGGLNVASNLRLICSQHHALAHKGVPRSP